MTSKLERIMSKRKAQEARQQRLNQEAQRKAEEKKAKEHEEFVKKEFTRLFPKLIGLVPGEWDKNGWGWTFRYRNHDFWISYDSWHYEKTPGDVDDYDQSGYHWVLKDHFNRRSGDGYFILSSHISPSEELTEKVLEGLGRML